MAGLLEPEIVAWLEERHGTGAADAVERDPLISPDSATAATLERLRLPATLDGPARYVVKRLVPRGDWIARATNDDRLREARLAVSGLLRSLPVGIGTAVIAAVPLAGGAFTLLMHDVAPALVPPGDDPLPAEQLERSLRALAALHSGYFGLPARLTSGLGLCTLGAWLTLLAPATSRREEVTVPRDPVTPHIVPGWDAFARLAPESWTVVAPLLGDAAPLVAALRTCPDTLLHGDAKAGNLAFTPERVILLDWSLTLRGPGALDLSWYLAVNSARLGVPREDAIEIYRAERKRLGRLPARGEPWERELGLALLAGTLRLGWAKALGAESDDTRVHERELAELAFWSRAALDGAAFVTR